MKRVFIAIRVEAGAGLQRMIETLKALLGMEIIKWVDLQNIHVTLAFLGDTEEKSIRSLAAMIKDRCSGFGSFEFTLAGTGVFRNLRDPRVLWTGINSSEALERLSELIAGDLVTNGFNFDKKPFRPHLTLGRIKSVSNIKNLELTLAMYRDTEFQKVNVREVILFESILKPTGAIYKPLARFSLD